MKKAYKIDTSDIQGLLIDSYASMPASYYIFLTIEDPEAFRLWMRASKFDNASYRPAEKAMNIAFTKSGLEAMGIEVQDKTGFSRAFVEGMDTDHRNRILGDIGENAPENWRWGNRNDDELHVLILLFASNEERLKNLYIDLMRQAFDGGFKEIHEKIVGGFLPAGKEHFGFKDGISQPRIKGIHSEKFSNDWLAPGEFILGYPNEYGKIPNSPSLATKEGSLGMSGSYLVYRQLEQDVQGFWKAMLELTESEAADMGPAIDLASKMVGRTPEGKALALEGHPKVDELSEGNHFNYYQEDPDGQKCPFGAHIRRTNPRDSLSTSKKGKSRKEAIQISKNHRILRKGRPYGPPMTAFMDIKSMLMAAPEIAEAERGLNFICFNADIDRQFEFIQHTWVNNPKFHDMFNDVDPLIGVQPDEDMPLEFRVPTGSARKRYTNIPQFVKVVGGSYFFFPGIHAIEHLANIHQSIEASEQAVAS